VQNGACVEVAQLQYHLLLSSRFRFPERDMIESEPLGKVVLPFLEESINTESDVRSLRHCEAFRVVVDLFRYSSQDNGEADHLIDHGSGVSFLFWRYCGSGKFLECEKSAPGSKHAKYNTGIP
jgi:hypothetical protein